MKVVPKHSAVSAILLAACAPMASMAAAPYINSYSPIAGRAGTVITVQGSGFTSVTQAWVGSGHDAHVHVTSDTQLEITVPTDATSGAVGIMSAKNESFSPTSFSMIGAIDPIGRLPISGHTGGTGTGGGRPGGGNGSGGTGTTLAISVSGNKLVNAAGTQIQLRGVNYSGYESTAIQGWDPTDPSGAQAGQAGGPNLPALATWKVNALRLPLNEASWLDYSCTDTSGVVHNPDPGSNYKSSVETLVKNATAAGIYVILDLHRAAPGNSCPMLQTQMADNDHSIAFWSSIASTFKSNPGVLFELFNEPYLYGLTGSESAWPVMMQGGTLSYYPATSNSSAYKTINTTWTIASMQAMLNAVRGTGATNVILVGGVNYCNDLSSWLANMPTDSLKQLAAAWHPYPPEQTVSTAAVSAAGSGFKVGDTITLPQPNTVYAPAVLGVSSISSGGGITALSVQKGGSYLQTSLPTGAVSESSTTGSGKGAAVKLTFVNQSSTWSMPANWATVQAISAKVPVIITETGEHDAAGTSGSPFLQQLLPFADSNGWSVVGWAWDLWGNPDNVLIESVSGTPTSGYGQVFQQWMTGAAYQ